LFLGSHSFSVLEPEAQWELRSPSIR
jgi:hypothetical protein